MGDVDVAINDVRPSDATHSAATTTTAYTGGTNAAATGATGSREVWRAPLSRGDSSVSARDSKYWLSVASSSSSAWSFPSSVAVVSTPVSEASPSALVDLRRQSILPMSIPIPSPIEKPTRGPLLARHHLSTSPLKCGEGGEFLNPFTFTLSPATVTEEQSPVKQAPVNETTAARQRRNSEFSRAIVAEEVYENQRYQMVLGWGSKGHLLPLDPGKFMRAIRCPPRCNSRGSSIIARAAIRKSRRRRSSLGDFTFGSPHTVATAPALRGGFEGELDGEDGEDLDDDQYDEEEENCDIQWAHSPVFPDISLPECASMTSTRWEWISPWHLEFPPHTPGDPPADADGWQYSTSFQHFDRLTSGQQRAAALAVSPVAGPQDDQPQQRKHSQSCVAVNPLVSSFWRPRHYVRCRKWVRYRRLRASGLVPGATQSELPEVNAFDDSFLDSMHGWLRKLGHVRKNWKSRYFVLEKSVLRYYADESLARLKGEVLLFHPATRVHYVDIHLSGGKDCTFAIHVGKDYALLLQADQLSDRENWMYCIEDALLCRDSYHQDSEQVRDLRQSVALRRKLSSESMVFNNGGLGGIAGLGGFGPFHPLNLLVMDSKTIMKKAAPDSHVMRLLAECDAFLESREVKQLALGFIQKFKQKYAVAQANNNVGDGRRRGSSDAQHQHQQRDSTSVLDSPTVAVLHDVRSLLALKNYRFFIERSLATVLSHLSQLPFVTGSPITSPRGYKASAAARAAAQAQAQAANNLNNFNTTSLISEDEWQLVRKAALYKLERMTFIPLQDVIYNLLESTISPQELEAFEHQRWHLGAQTQAFFEIPDSHTSSSQWKTAIALLNTVDNYSLPCEKSSVLLEVAKCIYETHAHEHTQESVAMMAADDFLPIFICILARCSLRNVVVARHLVSETMISAMMIGETGYYATMLEAAVGYIASFEVPTTKE